MLKIFKHGLIYIKDGKMLLCKKKGLDKLILPGGKPEGNESPVDSLIREIKEELGDKVHLDTKSIKYIATFSDQAEGQPSGTILEMEIYEGKISGEIKPSSEIDSITWFSPDDDRAVLSTILRNKIIPFLILEEYL